MKAIPLLERKSSDSGWSLLEILVACSIISILGVMLFPVLSLAQDRVRTVKCASNLRQIFLGVQTFANDNNGFYPTSMASGLIWHARIAPYVGVTLLAGETAGAPPCRDTIFLCPLAYRDTSPQRSYDFNSRIGDNVTTTDDKLTAVANPGQTVMIADAKNTSWLQSSADISCRHGKSNANLLFFDGHIEGATYTDISTRTYSQFIRGQ
ncbi:MAG: hypothetical protein B9S32_03665 [Verrucomicrobia bacterium Tous-C9LFEB]|nr:MAG: hypothetical protein B9S32_03665 [Verrucomicrobia bacterium Tous-C9LFEB]